MVMLDSSVSGCKNSSIICKVKHKYVVKFTVKIFNIWIKGSWKTVQTLIRQFILDEWQGS